MILEGNESHNITLCGFLCSPVYRSSIKNFEAPGQFQSHLWTQRYYAPTSFAKVGAQVEKKKQLLEFPLKGKTVV